MQSWQKERRSLFIWHRNTERKPRASSLPQWGIDVVEILTPDEVRVVEEIRTRCATTFMPPHQEAIERSTGLSNVGDILKQLYARRIISVAHPRKPRSRRKWVLVEGVQYRVDVGASGSVQSGDEQRSGRDRSEAGPGVESGAVCCESHQRSSPGRTQGGGTEKTHGHREVEPA